MTRSFKRYPILKQDKVCKRVWNKRLRNKKFNYSLRGAQYKKVMINYDTWKYRWSLEQAVIQYYEPDCGNEFYTRYSTLNSWVSYWEKCCYRK